MDIWSARTSGPLGNPARWGIWSVGTSGLLGHLIRWDIWPVGASSPLGHLVRWDICLNLFLLCDEAQTKQYSSDLLQAERQRTRVNRTCFAKSLPVEPICLASVSYTMILETDGGF
ncbi:hypothetical protein DY000_02010037 [Brassica cretica]|uniref:Uncharacterized protein n=1 Tax=Brassica cretica TaxID=69181 RepID=A0ABQ7CI50_BRACR|nr:hypothetical protein DY000_02010037 [Brassica cretica]